MILKTLAQNQWKSHHTLGSASVKKVLSDSIALGRVSLSRGSFGTLKSGNIPLLPHLCEKGFYYGLRAVFLSVSADRPWMAGSHAPMSVAKRPCRCTTATIAPA